jgi:hypothetical protein
MVLLVEERNANTSVVQKRGRRRLGDLFFLYLVRVGYANHACGGA